MEDWRKFLNKARNKKKKSEEKEEDPPSSVVAALMKRGSLLVVEAQMLRDIEHKGETFTVVKENYVIGVLS